MRECGSQRLQWSVFKYCLNMYSLLFMGFSLNLCSATTPVYTFALFGTYKTT